MTTRNRFSDAYAIQQGACNPAGIARSLVEAIDAARADPAVLGTDGVCADPAVRLIAHQLAWILHLSEYDHDLSAYGRDIAICQDRAQS